MMGVATPATSTTAAFVGWHRADPSERWRPIVQADTEDAAFRQLLDAIKGGDKAVLVAGQDPNTPERPRRRF